MKTKSGFTLVELMVVVSIIAIITMIATPNVIRWVGTARFNSAVRDVQASIESMRLYAAKENSAATISFAAGASTYDTDKWKRGMGSGAAAHDTDTHNLPSGITVGTTLNLVFNSRGTATSFGTVTINGKSGLSLDIVVNITGGSRII